MQVHRKSYLSCSNTLGQLIISVLGNAGGISGNRTANLDIVKGLLAPLVASVAATLGSLGVGASPITGALRI